jgi:pyrroloquinoline quinone biosynthesis protein B
VFYIYYKTYFVFAYAFISFLFMKSFFLLPLLFLLGSISAQPSIVVLGTVQDAGSPQIGCTKDCCKKLFAKPDVTRKVVSLGLVDLVHKSSYLFEATPDIATQLHLLKSFSNTDTDLPNGIFLTHAHIGHYTGLMYLGKEAHNTQQVPVYSMPRMKTYLEQNGPWSQLVSQKNIVLNPLTNEVPVQLNPSLQVTPLLVPHRDEYSETVGFIVNGPNKRALFIPDIDKWEKWNRNIDSLIATVDYAFIDATFFDAAEINNRNINEIPHPFVIESMKRFEKLSATDKKKIYFIHFNHTNPLLVPESEASKKVLSAGFQIAGLGNVFKL